MKVRCEVERREICFWQGQNAEIVLILFLTSGFAVFICLWFLVLPNSIFQTTRLIMFFYYFKYPLTTNIHNAHISYGTLKNNLFCQNVNMLLSEENMHEVAK